MRREDFKDVFMVYGVPERHANSSQYVIFDICLIKQIEQMEWDH